MVRTSKGPAEKSAPKKAAAKAAATAPAESPQSGRPADIDDATWAQIESMARSQGTTAGAVIKRAIVNQFGSAQPLGAYHSGQGTDTSKE